MSLLLGYTPGHTSYVFSSVIGWCFACITQYMITTAIDAEILLERATALAKESCRNTEVIDCVTILRGYLGLRSLQPTNIKVVKELDDAIADLLQAARKDSHWLPLLEFEAADESLRVSA